MDQQRRDQAVIARDETTVHRFGQLAIALFQGRVLGVTLQTGENRDDFTTLLQCDTVCHVNFSVKCLNKELHKLCARK